MGIACVPVVDFDQADTAIDADRSSASRSQDLWKCTRLPNVHVALHFAEFASEYGSIMSCNVLGGERKHKYGIISLLM